MDHSKTDEKLLTEFVAGRRAALGELAQRYERPLLGLAAGLLGGRQDLACDAVQETWLRVIRFGGGFNGRSRVKTWLYRITVNQCHTLRSRPDTGGDLAVEPAQPAKTAGPESAAEAADSNHRIRVAVARLGDEARAVVLLCYHGGLTHAEAAEILEIPLGTLKSRLHAALTELRAALAETSS